MIKLKSLAASLALALLSVMPAHAQGVGQLGPGQTWANTGTSQARAAPTNVTALLDKAFGNTRGAILERGASGWGLVGPGTTGKAWVSNGSGADPAYQTLGITGGGTNCVAASGTCLDNITGFASLGLLNRTGAGTYTFVTPPAGAIVGTTDAQTLTNKVFNCANNTCTVRLASDVTGNLPFANFPSGVSDTVIGYWGASVASAVAINNCSNSLTYSTSTHTFGCNTLAGTGTVTQINAGTGIALSPSPITASGTVSLSNSMGANKVQVFATGGSTGTITVPTGAAWAKFTMVGAGGPGAGSGTATGSNPSGGGPTCISLSGAACTSPVYQAGGGNGGNWTTGTGPSGGTCSGSGSFLLAVAGADGLAQTQNASTGISVVGPAGGDGPFGFGHGGSTSRGASAGATGSGFGSGGQGGSTGATASSFTGPSGSGGAGCIAFIQSPAASYTYAVGSGNSGGTAGTNGFAGGNSAGGLIIAEFGFN